MDMDVEKPRKEVKKKKQSKKDNKKVSSKQKTAFL